MCVFFVRQVADITTGKMEPENDSKVGKDTFGSSEAKATSYAAAPQPPMPTATGLSLMTVMATVPQVHNTVNTMLL